MANIEKTVFISYRRKDISWALAVYQYLTSQKYDVFFDYTSLHSGDFEKVILSNIRARAHFVLILTPTALDRCSEPDDWLRREIETAVVDKRNIIPLFFDGFNFGSPGVAEKLTGKLAALNRYNGLEIPPGYFLEAMERLKHRYLNIPTNSVIHPVTTEIRKVVKETQIAADKAVEEQKADLEQITRSDHEKVHDQKTMIFPSGDGKSGDTRKNVQYWSYGIGVFLIITLGLFVLWPFLQRNEQPATATPLSYGTPATEFSTATVFPTSTREKVTSIPIVTPAAPELKIGSTMKSPLDDMIQVYVPEGDFEMGSTNGEIDEKPVHTVTLDAFWIDKTEVSNEMYKKCVDDEKCAEPSNTIFYSDSKYSSHPVVYVSWNNATAYCSWAGRRLPTEAEWEKAASKWNEAEQQNYVYPWGDAIDCSRANYWRTKKPACPGSTTEVNANPAGASPYGALNLAGNVWEWVSDWYGMSYYESLQSSTSPISNPQGPGSGKYKVFRGGSWKDGSIELHSANRGRDVPTTQDKLIGFRCVFSAAP